MRRESHVGFCEGPGRKFSWSTLHAFKKIFGSEKYKDLLMDLLNNVLGFTGTNKIREVKFLESVKDPKIASKRYSAVDVLCKDINGTQRIIQMSPVHRHEEFEAYVPFVQYYAANAYIKQIDPLEEVIFLAFVDHVMFPNKPGYKSSQVVFDKYSYDHITTDKHDLEKFSFTIIELPKFSKTKIEQLKNDEERWLYTFKYADQMTKKDLDRMFPVDIIAKAYAELNTSNWSEKELIACDTSLKRIMDANAIMEQKFDEGKEEGAKQAKIAVAKNLLKAGISIDIIVETIGLSVDEIKKLHEIEVN